MSELGSGNGSSYPTALDTDATQETTDDYARIAVPNDYASAIVAIEDELGISPKGSFATVVARLNSLSSPTGGGITRGITSALPAASAGIWFFDTTLGVLSVSDGTSWYPILMGGG